MLFVICLIIQNEFIPKMFISLCATIGWTVMSCIYLSSVIWTPKFANIAMCLDLIVWCYLMLFNWIDLIIFYWIILISYPYAWTVNFKICLMRSSEHTNLRFRTLLKLQPGLRCISDVGCAKPKVPLLD